MGCSWQTPDAAPCTQTAGENLHQHSQNKGFTYNCFTRIMKPIYSQKYPHYYYGASCQKGSRTSLFTKASNYILYNIIILILNGLCELDVGLWLG